MTKRRTVWAGVAAVSVLGLLSLPTLLALWSAHHALAAARRIETGMREPDVQALLGRPADDRMDCEPGCTIVRFKKDGRAGYLRLLASWHDEKVSVRVFFDDDGRALGKQIVPFPRHTWLSKAAMFLGL
jgi:hypothetical protein